MGRVGGNNLQWMKIVAVCRVGLKRCRFFESFSSCFFQKREKLSFSISEFFEKFSRSSRISGDIDEQTSFDLLIIFLLSFGFEFSRSNKNRETRDFENYHLRSETYFARRININKAKRELQF